LEPGGAVPAGEDAARGEVEAVGAAAARAAPEAAGVVDEAAGPAAGAGGAALVPRGTDVSTAVKAKPSAMKRIAPSCIDVRFTASPIDLRRPAKGERFAP